MQGFLNERPKNLAFNITVSCTFCHTSPYLFYKDYRYSVAFPVGAAHRNILYKGFK